MRLLVVNAGSSSLKLSLLERAGDGWELLDEPDDLDAGSAAGPDAVGHRVVHGGDRTAAAVVDDAVVEELAALTDLAPLHQPPALAALARARAALPGVPHVVCFDTAFHTTLAEEARTYALPARLRARVRVHGFHGLSHAWASSRAAPASKVVVAHLGNGSSLCAVRDGRSVDTTMGFTPVDGLVMGTRTGSLDPGAVAWLVRQGEDLEQVLEREGGLRGLGGSNDVRELLAREQAGDADAALALAVWLHRAVRLTGSMVAVLGGLDALVLTGGIGEHSAELRERLCDRLAWLGVRLGPLDGEDATGPGSAVRVLVVHAREDLQIAREVRALLG